MFLSVVFSPCSTRILYAEGPTLDAKAYIVLDADTGEIVYESNSAAVLVPASMTKLMTLYLTLEQIACGELSWADQAVISDYSNLISRQRSLSSFELTEGAQYTIQELFYAAALNSSNAAAIALAEHIGGTEGGFVDMMNEQARDFGLTDVSFVNSSGLNNNDLFGHHKEGTQKNQDTKLSARSMATIAYRLVNDYPEYLNYSSLTQKTIREGQSDQLIIRSTNRMLPGRDFAIDGIKGLKTGYTANAVYCFAGLAVRESGRFISVVMGASTSAERFNGSGRLLEYGFLRAEESEESEESDETSSDNSGDNNGNNAGNSSGMYIYPDSLNYYKRGANGTVGGGSVGIDGGGAGMSGVGRELLSAYGDTGFGVMRNGRTDVVALNGELFNVSRRGRVSRLGDASGVGTAAMTYLNPDSSVEITGKKTFEELKTVLAQSIDEDSGNSYCFRVSGVIKPTVITTLANPESRHETNAPFSGGTVVGFYNGAGGNEIMPDGFTFYYISADKETGGVLLDADFENMNARIDLMEPIESFYTPGEELPIVGTAAA